ncbi:MAG: hypothetical protein FWG54_01620, partial [Bacteroidetes bacterium]|nr:hypothetical protein [Bacteroidota bacterium]
ATIENDDECTFITTVVAVYDAYISGGTLYGASFGETNFHNGSFSITLPTSGIFDENMLDIADFFEGELGISGGPKYSKPEARVSYAEFLAFDSGNYLRGVFQYSSPDHKTGAIFIFADMDVNVTGGTNLSVSLKEGWNRLYYSPDKITTKAPKDMAWFFSDDIDM